MTLTDYSPLTRPVSPDEVRQFRHWAKTSGWIGTTRAAVSALQVVVIVIVAAVAFSVFASFLSFSVSLATHGTAAEGPVAALLPLVLFGVVAGLAVTAWRGWNGTPATWEKRLRLREFAAARSSTYTGVIAAPPYPGMIFGIGTSRQAYDSVRADTGRALDVGNYRYTVKQGKSSTTYRWGYVALRLDRRLPHMVLDAASNNLLFGSNLPRSFEKDSVLSLEGDFDRYFTLYCPPEYGRDALYVFTPDLMALLIDESSAFDVEIVDDWMFVYSTRPFDLLQPSVWQRLDRIVQTVGSKTLDQTRLYSDERVADRTLNIVAPQGQRLRRGVAPGAVVFAIVALAWLGFNLWRTFS